MRIFKTTGFIIKRRNIGEADQLITLFTREFGKITVKAKSIRKITSKRASSMELFNRCEMGFYKGPGMPTLTEVVPLGSYASLKKNLERIYTAYHMCELIDGLCAEDQENEQVFSLLEKSLTRLQTERQLKDFIREFEINLLTLLGFWGSEQVKSDTNVQLYIESLLERKLRSKNIYSKLL